MNCLSRRLASLLDPCFIFRPDTFLRACFRKWRPLPLISITTTPWGDRLCVEPHQYIGARIYMRGVHDLIVCEALFRLAEPGETVMDVGANVGLMTSALSRRVGASGRVISFEPHPATFVKLSDNVQRMARSTIQCVNAAASTKNGLAQIHEPSVFDNNDGTATLSSGGGLSGKSFEVQTVRLDEEFATSKFGVWKVDVEGHELSVFEGAEGIFKNRRVRDIVFESARALDTRIVELLTRHGFSILRLESGFWGPGLRPYETVNSSPDVIADYVATLDLERAANLLSKPGWRVLLPRTGGK